MLEALGLLIKFVWDALATHAASDEGEGQLKDVLNAVEAAGIDVPFYEPPTTEQEGSETDAVEGMDTDFHSPARKGKRFSPSGEPI